MLTPVALMMRCLVWLPACAAVVACGSSSDAVEADASETSAEVPAEVADVAEPAEDAADAAPDLPGADATEVPPDGAPEEADAEPVDDAGEPDEAEAVPVEPPFAFVVLADSHVTGTGENADRLEASVSWINAHVVEDNIEFAAVLGDIAWGAGFPVAAGRLDALDVPWVPILGDNEIHGGGDAEFQTAYAGALAECAAFFDDYRQAPTPATHPGLAEDEWLHNLAFTHRGIRFYVLDWNVRGDDGIGGEMGDLHDHAGGTLPWLRDQLDALEPARAADVVLISHIPMHLGGFGLVDMGVLDALLSPFAERIHANLAGHVHVTYSFPAGACDVLVTDAVFDDDNVVRLVRVTPGADSFDFTHELIVVP